MTTQHYIKASELYIAELEESSNLNHQECKRLEAIIVEQANTIAALKTQLRELANIQNERVLRRPEIAIAIIESYAAIEQKTIDDSTRLMAELRKSNKLRDRFTYSQQESDFKKARVRLKAWRSLLDAIKSDMEG